MVEALVSLYLLIGKSIVKNQCACELVQVLTLYVYSGLSFTFLAVAQKSNKKAQGPTEMHGTSGQGPRLPCVAAQVFIFYPVA